MLYFEVRPALRRLSDEEKGRLFEAILDYGENSILPIFDGCLGVAWDFIQPRIDADSQRYQRTTDARRAAANARWGQEKVQKDAFAPFAMQTMPTTDSTSTSATTSSPPPTTDKLDSEEWRSQAGAEVFPLHSALRLY